MAVSLTRPALSAGADHVRSGGGGGSSEHHRFLDDGVSVVLVSMERRREGSGRSAVARQFGRPAAGGDIGGGAAALRSKATNVGPTRDGAVIFVISSAATLRLLPIIIKAALSYV